ncbi:MAG: branched-chain amino acid transport system ATP-binding protein, partial [Thermomicrobiales bacterium]|nr:branched-chain amino acid transport system ATP-binding protein [Thermomicrobiales bacterium]
GLLQPRRGQILLNGTSLNGVPAHKVATMGVAQSPEGRRVFPRMSVLENLEMGAFTRGKADPNDLARVFDLFPRLKERINQKAGTMSGGEQQMLAIGRALMAHPSLLLLDEPSMGLSPILVEAIFAIVKEINAQGTTVLLVEQNALMALGIAHRGYVLQTGQIVLSDNAGALLRNETVRKAYLGEE